MKLKDLLLGAASLVRTGWMQRGVPPAIGETVGTHSFYAAVIALEIAERLKERGVDVNPERACAIAVTHDLAEVVVGDIPKWSSDRLKGKKEELEKEALNGMNSLRVIKYSLMYLEEGREQLVAKAAETLATLWQAETYVDMGIKRVEEIAKSMAKGLEKVVERAEEMDKNFGEALRDVLRELGWEG